MLDLYLDSISLLDNIRHKIVSSNIIVPSPNTSVESSERVEKSSTNLDDIEEPVVIIHRKYLDNKK